MTSATFYTFENLIFWLIKRVCEEILDKVPEEEAGEGWQLCIEYLNMTDPPSSYPITLEDISDASKTVLLVLYSLTITFSTLGNVCVLAFSGSRHFRSVNSVFIVSLAVSDLLLTFLCMPFNMTDIINRTSGFGNIHDFACKYIPHVQMTTVLSTWFIITCIAVERYVAVFHPMRAKSLRKRRHAMLATVSVWVASAVMAVPNILLYDITAVAYVPPLDSQSAENAPAAAGIGYSYRDVPLGASFHVTEDEGETLIPVCVVPKEKRGALIIYRWFNVVALLLPLTWMTYAYIRIVRRLWVRKSMVQGPGGSKQVGAIRLRLYKRVVKAVVAMMVLFSLCWTPTIIFEAVAATLQLEATETFLNVRYYLAWLAYSNAFHNPVVYTFLNANWAHMTGECCRSCPGRAHARVQPEVLVAEAKTRSVCTCKRACGGQEATCQSCRVENLSITQY